VTVEVHYHVSMEAKLSLCSADLLHAYNLGLRASLQLFRALPVEFVDDCKSQICSLHAFAVSLERRIGYECVEFVPAAFI
jgi:hypothetical protein